jgi:hypothetical protein
MAKLFLILGIVAAALIACLRVAGVISEDLASDSLAKILGIIAILGFAVAGISAVAGSKKSSEKSSGPGPKF